MKPVKARLIYNPTAGQGRWRPEILKIVDGLSARGWLMTLHETRAPGDATHFAREAVQEGERAVVVAGGDGTINEAINGLALSDTALGVLPVGLCNVWAADIGIPMRGSLAPAAEILALGHTRRIDLGQAGERFFILAAGVGFDGQVVQAIARTRRRLGKLSYVLTALRVASSYRGKHTRLRIDGKVLSGSPFWILVGNLQLYGGVMRIARRARLDDGLLDVVVFRGRTIFHSLPSIAYLLSLGRLRTPQVEYYQIRELLVEGSGELPVHVDAELAGHTPMTFRAAPGALRVIVPAQVPPGLFNDPGQQGSDLWTC